MQHNNKIESFINIGNLSYHMVENITNIGLEIINLYRTNYLNHFHVREMAKLVRKSHVGLLPHLQKLEEDKILQLEHSGKNKVYTLNLENNRGKEYLSIAEKVISLKFIKRDFFIKKIHDEIVNINPGGCFILFGSYALSTQTKESDIDLFYFGTINNKQKTAIEELGKLYKRKLHLTTMSFREFKNALKKGLALLKEIIKNHIILYNHDLFINEVWRDFYERKKI